MEAIIIPHYIVPRNNNNVASLLPPAVFPLYNLICHNCPDTPPSLIQHIVMDTAEEGHPCALLVLKILESQHNDYYMGVIAASLCRKASEQAVSECAAGKEDKESIAGILKCIANKTGSTPIFFPSDVEAAARDASVGYPSVLRELVEKLARARGRVSRVKAEPGVVSVEMDFGCGTVTVTAKANGKAVITAGEGIEFTTVTETSVSRTTSITLSLDGDSVHGFKPLIMCTSRPLYLSRVQDNLFNSLQVPPWL